MLELESRIFYEKEIGIANRNSIHNMYFKKYPAGCFIAEYNNKIAGYSMSRPGRVIPIVGPLIADSPEIAHKLLAASAQHWEKQGYSRLSLVTPQCHFRNGITGMSLSEIDRNKFQPQSHSIADSIQPVRPLARMYISITKNDIPDLIEQRIAKGAGRNDISNLKKMYEKAVDNFGATEKHRENEISQILPRLYAVSGPELG